METPVVQIDLGADHLEAAQGPFGHGFFEALFAAGDKFFWNRAANTVVFKHEVDFGVLRQRHQLANNVRVLTGTTGLFFVLIVKVRGESRCLAVVNLWLADRSHWLCTRA